MGPGGRWEECKVRKNHEEPLGTFEVTALGSGGPVQPSPKDKRKQGGAPLIEGLPEAFSPLLWAEWFCRALKKPQRHWLVMGLRQSV